MRRHALLIGVDRYDDERITPPRYAADDAWALAAAFIERCRFDEVIVLAKEPPYRALESGGITRIRHGGRPTLKNIIDHLRRLATQLSADSLFVFGFSGHGVEDKGRKEAYLYAADSLADHHIVDSLPVGTLLDLLSRLPTRWQVLLLDAGRNDPRAGRGDTDNSLGDILAKNLVGFTRNEARAEDRHTAFLCACRPGQRAYEWPNFKHSVCTHYLLQGLTGAAWTGGRLTFRGLAHHAKIAMEGWPEAVGLQQEPWFEQSDTEDIVMGVQDDTVLNSAAEAAAPAMAAADTHLHQPLLQQTEKTIAPLKTVLFTEKWLRLGRDAGRSFSLTRKGALTSNMAGTDDGSGAFSTLQVKIGDANYLELLASQAGHVTLINPGTSGDFYLLTPNDGAPSVVAQAGQRLTSPGALIPGGLPCQDGPIGEEYLVAFITPQPIFDPAELGAPDHPMGLSRWDPETNGPIAPFRHIAPERIARMEQQLAALPSGGWAVAVLRYRVVRA